MIAATIAETTTARTVSSRRGAGTGAIWAEGVAMMEDCSRSVLPAPHNVGAAEAGKSGIREIVSVDH